jgi:hypothetical protein
MSAITNIEQSVLSESFQRAMDGQRLVTALFTTFAFDPGFFEMEVLRIFFDITLAHSPALRLVQMEDALRDLPTRPAVYYDPAALQITDSGPAKLDIARHPVRMNACFHPKLVCALVENADGPSSTGRKLIVACQSANLTRAGWWENLECSHIEIMDEGAHSSFSESLTEFLRWLGDQSPEAPPRMPGIKFTQRFKDDAVGSILSFLEKAPHRKRQIRSPLSPRFIYTDIAKRGRTLTEMLDEEGGKELNGMNLEIISPYFDDADSCLPLQDLIKCIQPREVRVHLPRDAQGVAQVSSRLHAAVQELSTRSCPVSWGSIPEELLRGGPAAQAAPRFTHAKVYRFFSSSPKRELWLVGSANLTRSAHQSGGNMECGFLVERCMSGQSRPIYLVQTDEREPKEFRAAVDPLESADKPLTRLALRFDWKSETAAAWWAETEPPPIHLSVAGIELGSFRISSPGEWQSLGRELSKAIQDHLISTSLFIAKDDHGHTGHVLIIEDGMTQKPSQILALSAADILRYWSMLTPEQRSSFLEWRLNSLLLEGSNDGVLPIVLPNHEESLFDRVAGFFHAFHTLERFVKESIETRRSGRAVARLFGKKHDSLSYLLDRLDSDDDPIRDNVDRYLIVFCARQSLTHIKLTQPEFWSKHQSDAKKLLSRVNELKKVLRPQLLTEDLSEDFLDWFDREFLRRSNMEVNDEQD